ncbi:MAG: 16S rRNA (guanine(966)-N(2))-methyltransferase RsmD [Burkholderiales bacterium]
MKANRVRIVGGEWRSRCIDFPDGRGLRPTPDRVRETLFNWLGQDLAGKRCLDLYAGSGALGFEAASRGAKQVVLVERERVVCAALEASRAALQAERVQVIRADALEFLSADSGVYDVVFLDPPFADDPWAQLFERLPQRLAPGALVYRESGEKQKRQAAPEGWTVFKQGRAGQVNYQLLKRTTHDDQSGLPRNV